MFYSQTLLARKTPLGTVWCAAHLQHRLNKKDYERTKISIVVDAIMFGEVPLALRTSSYLLLGVVRIYSKQLDYLKHDLDVLAAKINSHTSAKLTLPENARQAPFHFVTLPETFDLDALELDNDVYHDGVPDNHLKSQEEITLADQVFVGRDAYIAITFDEDVMMDISPPGVVPDSGLRSMEEDILHPPPMDSNVNLQPGPSTSEDVLNEENVPQSFPGVEVPRTTENQEFGPSTQSVHDDDISLQIFPQFETLRDAADDFGPQGPPILPPVGGNETYEPFKQGDENINPGNLLPIAEDMETLPRTSLPFEQSAGPPASATSQEAPEMIHTHSSLKFALRSATPQQPKASARKRKQFFDTSTVLTNKFMKKAVEDSSELLRERKNIPSTSLTVWKLKNSLRNEQVFCHSSTNGFCPDLCDLFKDGYIATKCRLTSLEEACQDPEDARNESSLDRVVTQSPAPEAGPSPDFQIPPTVDPAYTSNLETEILRSGDVEDSDRGNIMADLIASPERFISSPGYHEGLGSVSVAAATTVMSTPDQLLSTGPSKYMSETTGTFHERLSPENATLFDIPELFNATDGGELDFLVADNTPTGSRGTKGVDSLSVRTRAVGRYLRSLSPIKSISGDSTQDLGLNGILEGKSRKLCARMFYEILVLKSYGLIDVQQDEPYSDINVKLTPKLSKAQM